jgi:Domain of unknown function (DUF1876)/Domain of unknown function (DUF1918)
MKAAVGDRVFVASGRPGHERMGRIVELRHPDGTPPYVVRWDDTGTDEVSFLRHDCRIEPGRPPQTAAPRPTAAPTRVRTWTVDIEVLEDGVATLARAVLHEDEVPTVVTADGHATRNPNDEDVPEIGDELAVARALDQLAGTLKAAAARHLAAMDDPGAVLVDVRPALDLR